MPDPRVPQILRALREGTDAGQLRWTATSEEDTYRLLLGSGLFRVSRYLRMPSEHPQYRLVMLDKRNEEIDVIESGDPETGEGLAGLFSGARRSALNLDDALDSILRELTERTAGQTAS